MPRRLILSLGALALGLGAAALALRLASPTPVSAAPRPAYEHKVLLLAFDEYKEKDDYKEIERREKDTFRAVLAFHEYALNHLGKEGWQVVGIEAKTPAQTVFYLERPAAP